MLLVVLETFGSLAVEALFAVEQIGGLVPYIAQSIDVEGKTRCSRFSRFTGIFRIYNLDASVVERRITDLRKADTLVLQELHQFLLVTVADLDDHTWVLCKEHLHDVVAVQVVQVDVHTALCIGKAHFQ